jgi:hypothetical protein
MSKMGSAIGSPSWPSMTAAGPEWREIAFIPRLADINNLSYKANGYNYWLADATGNGYDGIALVHANGSVGQVSATYKAHARPVIWVTMTPVP